MFEIGIVSIVNVNSPSFSLIVFLLTDRILMEIDQNQKEVLSMQVKGSHRKAIVLFLLALSMGLFYYFGGSKFLSFPYLKAHLNDLVTLFEANPAKMLILFSGIYFFLTALSLPGSIILTVLAGTIFGTPKGALLVTFLGTIGATTSFILSRYLFKDYLNVKFRRQFNVINRNLKKEGILYIIGVRLIPVSPFVIVNLMLGLTEIKMWTFFWTTSVGMLPGNLIYVYAGTKIRKIEKLSEVMTPEFLISLTLLGCLPFLVKKLITIRRNKTLPV